ncbi:hypothetical protein JW968_01285 [Candidatus Woesearchaeota archaeon]|nr:hypothetical protein [Candidatus Woesearchaeota archaeon]
MKRKHEERFCAAKYIERRQKAEAYFRFLKHPQARRLQEHFHNIVEFGEDRQLSKIIAK